jgi:signal transduction histidine kinase
MMKKVLFLFVNLLICCTFVHAEEVQKSELQQKAEAVDPQKHIASARSLYIQAFSDYANKGQMRQGVECAVKATALYYKENFWKEAFDLLRRVDQTIISSKIPTSEKAASHYLVTKERMQMYMRLRKGESVKEQLRNMESLANQSGDESVKNDLLYNKAIYYYTYGMNQQGNAVFKEMADKLTASKDYDKVDEVYQTLIANGRRSNNANMVAQSYSNYIAWKDSTSAIKHADEINALKKQIADNEAAISERDSSLSTRWMIIVGLGILAAALAAALIVGAVILMRFIFLTRKQKKVIKLANESNALKAKFISNISAQLEPTFKKLDSRQPEVKALLEFSQHIQTLSELENTPNDAIQLEDTQVQSFCEGLMDGIRDKVKSNVNLTVNAQKMSAPLYKEYVTHILQHLLENAAIYTPEGGNIWLEFKKRGPHSYQFLVADTGCGIAEERREDVFKPFLEIHDLTEGDGLGLPICKQMALKMNGDLEIDPQFTKGTRFILDLHS